MPSHARHLKLYSAIGLLSAAIIAFQLALMQVFSITQWHHFAYMAISVALLGFGAAGTFLSLFAAWLQARHAAALAALSLLCAISMAWAVGATQLEPVRFDLFLLFNDPRHAWRLLATYLLLFLPFFFGALAIGLAFVQYVAQIGRVYFANLLGSGLGGAIALLLMARWLPHELPTLLAVLPLAAGWIWLPPRARWLRALTFISTALVVLSMLLPPRLHLSEFKSLSKTLLLPDAEVLLEKSSPYGLLQAVASPALRHAPGLSLNYLQPVPVYPVLFNNGEWAGAIVPRPAAAGPIELDYTTAALPYLIRSPERVLIPGSGTGEAIAHALARGSRRVVAIEPNAALLSILSDELAKANDSLFHHPALETHRLEARTWLMSDTAHYDLVVLPTVSAFGGSAGVYALREQFAMTTEAFAGMWERLEPEGLLAITCWMDYPARNPLKLLATLAAVLEARAPGEIEHHIAAVRSWGAITFVVSKAPLADDAVARIREYCEEMSFDPLLLPGLRMEERQQFNQLQDSLFFGQVDALLRPGRDSLYRSYAFNIRPATDQRPFFSQFLRWRHLPQLSEWASRQNLPFLELGYLVAVVTLAQLSLVALILIILPLFKLRRRAPKAGGLRLRWIWLYFGGIGLGYMFLEIVLIQQFILFFGNPIYAATAAVGVLLIASGAGSYYSGQLQLKMRRLQLVPLLIAGLLAGLAFALPTLLQAAVGWPLALKALLFLALVAPLGFCMGIPFPAGLSLVAQRQPQAVPWAWAVNGFLSVISAALAAIVAVELGFSWALLLAAGGYLTTAAALAAGRWARHTKGQITK
jgi:SAM-dependent methyltransferase